MNKTVLETHYENAKAQHDGSAHGGLVFRSLVCGKSLRERRKMALDYAMVPVDL